MAKWRAVIGSRVVTAIMTQDIEEDVTTALDNGWSIVSGGSTGADFVAARKVFDTGHYDRLRIYLPVALSDYISGFRQRVASGKADEYDTERMIELLLKLSAIPGIIYDATPYEELTPSAFWYRNRRIVDLADELVAFRSGPSAGTSYTIDYAKDRGVKLKFFDY